MGSSPNQYESVLKRLDERRVSLSSDEILCFSCVRNEFLRLPYFIEYHRRMGINRFFFIDNDSDDGTREYLLSQPDTHLFYTDGSYADSKFGIDWVHELLNRYAKGHWALTLDADELFVFPDCEHLTIQQLVQYLEDTDAEGFVTFLLDFYSEKPIRETFYTRGAPFTETCRYFDGNTYDSKIVNGIPLEGGPRLRLFSKGGHTPHLRKVPLVRWRRGLWYESSTHVIENVNLSGLTGALLHFKFFSEFEQYVEQEVDRSEHWNNAAEYRLYSTELAEHPDLSLYYEGSQLYKNSMQLLDMGLINMPDTFKEFAANRLSKRRFHSFLSSLLTRFKNAVA